MTTMCLYCHFPPEKIMACYSEIGISKSRLCKNARIVGLYGVAGVGKSTVCMVLAHSLNREFQGRACHVVFGNSNIQFQLQLALKQLTGANHDFVHRHINSAAEGWTCLKERMPRQRVFLALDNESDKPESWEVAKNFLYRLEYHVNSMVLVTSRSKDVLEKVLGIPESCCMHCPCVTAEDAVKIVLDHNGLENIEALTKEQRHILHRAVEMCDLGGFHPMVLKVLATQLGRNPFSWRLSSLSLSEALDTENMLFTEMETIFLRMSDEMRDIFMDIALFTPEIVNNVHELCLWLMNTLHSGCGSLDEVRKKLDALRLKSLLEVWSLDSDKVCMHDLHRELAKRRARLGDASGNRAARFVHQTCGKFDLSMMEQAERACFIGTSCTKMAFDGCSKDIKLLSVRSCLNLVELELQGLARLVSLELNACPMESLDLKDLKQLKWLCLTSCPSLTKVDTSGCKALVCVCISKCNELEDLDFKNSDLLESVSVSYIGYYLEVIDLGSGICLRRLAVWFCEALKKVKMSDSVCLHEFKKRGCPMLLNLDGCQKLSQDVSCLIVTRWQKISAELITALQASRCLTVLDLWDCPVSRLPDLRNCSGLRELKFSDIDVLLDSDDKALQHEYADILCASSDELALPESLQEMTIGDCRITVVKEVCWKLRGLRNVLVLSLQRVRVSWDWELYRSSTKAFSPSLCRDNTQRDPGSLRDQLHRKIGIQPEEASDATQSCSDEMSTNKIFKIIFEIAGEVSSFQQTAQISGVEMPSTVIRFEQVALERGASTSHKSEKPSTFIKMLSNVIYWILEFLSEEWMQSEVKDIITNSWQKQPVQSPLEEYTDSGESWGRLFMCDEMRKVCHRSPDYVLLEAYDNFDSLWKFCVETVNRRVINEKEVLEKLKDQTAYQLKQQLRVLHALSSSENPKCSFGCCEPWEQKAMDEIFFFEHMITSSVAEADKEVMYEKLGGDGCMFSPWRFKQLQETVSSIITCRLGKKLTGLWEQDIGYSGQWQQDWLKSCKICMAMQVLCVSLNQEDLQAVSLHRQWFSDMVREVDCLFQSKIEEVMTITTGRAPMEDLMRAWTARQRLQKLGLSLSGKWVEGDIREILAPTTEGELGLQAYCRLGEEEIGSTKLQVKPTLVDVVDLQGRLKQALKRLHIELSDVQWEANHVWLNKYCVVENAMRQEDMKWRCSTSLHPSHNRKEAALEGLCDAIKEAALHILYDSKEEAALYDLSCHWEGTGLRDGRRVSAARDKKCDKAHAGEITADHAERVCEAPRLSIRVLQMIIRVLEKAILLQEWASDMFIPELEERIQDLKAEKYRANKEKLLEAARLQDLSMRFLADRAGGGELLKAARLVHDVNRVIERVLHRANVEDGANVEDLLEAARRQKRVHDVIMRVLVEKDAIHRADVEELLEAARLQKRVHDMIIRLELNPSVNDFDRRYKWFVQVYSAQQNLFAKNLENLHVRNFRGEITINLGFFRALVQESLCLPYSLFDLPYSSFDLVEGSAITDLSQAHLNWLVTTSLGVDLVSRLTSTLDKVLTSSRRRMKYVNAIISFHADNLKLTLPVGLQMWVKAEEFPLRTTWQAINNEKPFVLPVRSRLRCARITSENVVIPFECRSHDSSKSIC